ncbi:MAG: MJ1255/VC2487 family glycosyltransferase [Candidatus Sericytochromatia bacterium]
MKILYGVVGEGMGHAIRSKVIISKLLEMGHEVKIVVSGRAFDFLKKNFEGVNKIWGLTMVMEDNEIQKRETALEVLKGSIEGLPENIKKYFELTKKFEPDCVISDFETWSAFYGYNNMIPVISIDNMQIIRRCWHPDEILRGRHNEWNLAKSVIKSKIPKADHYLITTFFYPEIKKKNTTLVSPILRDEIINAKTSEKEHILVYQTGESFKELPNILKKFDKTPFKIYGLKRNLDKELVEENLTFCPFSEKTFVEDLSSAKAVIASAGFTLAGEAVHLGKPYLATPVKGQFEQIINARYIEYLGYGLQDEELDEFSIRHFIKNIDSYKRNLLGYEKKDNSELFNNIEKLLLEIKNKK